MAKKAQRASKTVDLPLLLQQLSDVLTAGIEADAPAECLFVVAPRREIRLLLGNTLSRPTGRGLSRTFRRIHRQVGSLLRRASGAPAETKSPAYADRNKRMIDRYLQLRKAGEDAEAAYRVIGVEEGKHNNVISWGAVRDIVTRGVSARIAAHNRRLEQQGATEEERVAVLSKTYFRVPGLIRRVIRKAT